VDEKRSSSTHANSRTAQLPPNVGVFFIGAMILAASLRKALGYSVISCKRPDWIIASYIGSFALNYVRIIAAVSGLSGRTLAWQRTPKFAVRLSVLHAVRGAVPELIATLFLLGLLLYVLSWRAQIGNVGVFFAGGAVLVFFFTFGAALVMALLASRKVNTIS